MSELTFRDLRKELMQLHKAKEYTQAFDLIEKEQTHFPDNSLEISYWRISLKALLGKQADALEIFREGLDKGDLFPPRWMERDPDLASLHPLPEFQAMIEVCRQRLAQMRSESHPDLLVRQPVKQATPLPLLIAMHGNGNNMHNTVEHWSEVTNQGWLLAVPQSSQIVGTNAFVWDERETGISEVRAHLTELNSEHMIDPERVVLGGFSMGGGQAIWMALHQSVKTDRKSVV